MVEAVEQQGRVVEQRGVDPVQGRVETIEAQCGKPLRGEAESDRDREEDDAPDDPVGGGAEGPRRRSPGVHPLSVGSR
jgi:hypothetical protein